MNIYCYKAGIYLEQRCNEIDKFAKSLDKTQLIQKISFVALTILFKALKWVSEELKAFIPVSYRKGQELSQEIEKLRKAAEPGWQEQAVKMIRKSREDTLGNEAMRLAAVKALTVQEQAALSKAVYSVWVKKSSAKIREQTTVLMSQAHEIKKIYGDTHHLFLHGQSLVWSVVPLLIKELIREFNPEQEVGYYKFLRAEGSAVSDSYWDWISSWTIMKWLGFSKEASKTAGDYIAQNPYINDDDMKTRETILSVDGYFYNTQAYESCLYFLMNNNNILGDGSTALKNVIQSVFRHFKKDASRELIDTLSTRLMKSIAFTNSMTTTGNLYLIAIPKEKSADIQYRAHPFGPPCSCHQGKSHTQILEKLQQGILNETTKCKVYGCAIPQYRLFLPALKPGNGCKIFRMSPLPRSSRQSIKAAIKSIAQELHTS